MQRTAFTRQTVWRWGLGLGLAALAVWARSLLWNALLQLFFGMLVALLALPIMRRLEKRLSAGLAATLSMASLSAIGIGLALVLTPLLVQQGRQLAAFLPTLLAQVEQWATAAESWLRDNGMFVGTEGQSLLRGKGQELLSTVLPQAMERAGGMASGLGRLFFAPVFAYYFLRDRREIGARLLLCLPVEWRETAVLALREMRRETAGFLRGQLMVSAVVGLLTALGLLFCGVPAWLLLGAAMGVLELIPYAGPFLGGVLVALFSLPGGLSRTLWALGVVLLVQQLEGGMLSPQLMSDATRLHPVIVLLCLMLGGSFGGILGLLAAVPLVLCVRAAARVIGLKWQEMKRAE